MLAGQGDYAGANAEDLDEYKTENVFWVPADARWSVAPFNDSVWFAAAPEVA